MVLIVQFILFKPKIATIREWTKLRKGEAGLYGHMGMKVTKHCMVFFQTVREGLHEEWCSVLLSNIRLFMVHYNTHLHAPW